MLLFTAVDIKMLAEIEADTETLPEIYINDVIALLPELLITEFPRLHNILQMLNL